MTNKAPYPCDDYWHRLTDRQRLNDLIHKIAQLEGVPYPEAYHRAKGITGIYPAHGESLPAAIERLGEMPSAIDKLIEHHKTRGTIR